MIYFELLWSFLKVGALSFGGGYGMISLIRDIVLSKEWMTETELLNFIAVAESTPGPIAVNIATFIGASEGGFLGCILATLGVILPSFVIILLIATLATGLLRYAGVQSFLSGMRPCIVGLIFTTVCTMGLSMFVTLKHINDPLSVDVKAVIILAVLLTVHFISLKLIKKNPTPIAMILLSAGLGIFMYGIL